MEQSQRRALIIGGSRGVGAVAAQVCLDLGYLVVATSRAEAPQQKSPEKNIEWVPFDMQGPGAAERLAALVDLDDFDALVFTAGPYSEAALHETANADWQRLVEGNLLVPGQIASRVLEGMIRRNFGRIVLFGATGTDRIQARKLSAPYQAAKTGLAVLVKSIAAAYSQRNIVANLVNPGYIVGSDIQLGVADGASPVVQAPSGAGYKSPTVTGLPDLGGRLAEPDEFHAILRLLLDQESVVLNGSLLAAGKGL